MRISDWSSDVCSSDLRQFPDEARGDGTGPLAIDAPVGGVQDDAGFPRPRDRYIGKAAFLLQAVEAAFVKGALGRENAFFPPRQEDGVELQSLGGVDGHDRDLALVRLQIGRAHV